MKRSRALKLSAEATISNLPELRTNHAALEPKSFCNGSAHLAGTHACPALKSHLLRHEHYGGLTDDIRAIGRNLLEWEISTAP